MGRLRIKAREHKYKENDRRLKVQFINDINDEVKAAEIIHMLTAIKDTAKAKCETCAIISQKGQIPKVTDSNIWKCNRQKRTWCLNLAKPKASSRNYKEQQTGASSRFQVSKMQVLENGPSNPGNSRAVDVGSCTTSTECTEVQTEQTPKHKHNRMSSSQGAVRWNAGTREWSTNPGNTHAMDVGSCITSTECTEVQTEQTPKHKHNRMSST